MENHILPFRCHDFPERTVVSKTKHVDRLPTVKYNRGSWEYLSCPAKRRARQSISALPPLLLDDREVVNTPDSKMRLVQAKNRIKREQSIAASCKQTNTDALRLFHATNCVTLYFALPLSFCFPLFSPVSNEPNHCIFDSRASNSLDTILSSIKFDICSVLENNGLQYSSAVILRGNVHN